MTKKQVIGFIGGILCVAACCAFIVIYNTGRNTPEFAINDESASQGSFEIPELEVSKVAVADTPKIPAIKKKAPQVIPDETASKVDPSKDTKEIKNNNGETVQTHDWEAQKELPDDAELEDTEDPPEYKTPSTQKPAADSSSTPKNGDMKTIDGQKYMYVQGFGWVKYGDGNVGTTAEVGSLSGEKVGH